jgi:hypothetical protein
LTGKRLTEDPEAGYATPGWVDVERVDGDWTDAVEVVVADVKLTGRVA